MHGCCRATNSDRGSVLPVSTGPGLTYGGGPYDGFVAHVLPGATGIGLCGYLGGADDDRSYGVALDGPGDVYLTGFTTSDETTFPLNVGPRLVYSGQGDAFVDLGHIGNAHRTSRTHDDLQLAR